jgi:hypothetical protein
MRFTNIHQIRNHQFIGNAYHDMGAFNAIDDFVKDAHNSVADRVEALRQMQDRGMGCGRGDHLSDLDMLNSYLECVA